MPDRDLLGPWSDDDFSRTVRAAIAGVGTDADLPPDIRFLGSVAKLIRRRSAQLGAEHDPNLPAIFLLQPSPDHAIVASKREPMLDAGLTSLTGKLWFVGAVARSGRFIDLQETQENDALFSLVTDHLKLGAVPAIIFDPRPATQQLRFYRNGLLFVDDCDVSELATAEISIERLFEVIDKIWTSSLKTPRHAAQFGLWQNYRKVHPTQFAEQKIQAILRTGLQVGFPTCNPRPEDVLDAGRCDILLEEQDVLEPRKTTAHALLELKVFRSFTSTGTPVSPKVAREEVLKGIEQAHQYAAEKHAPIAALCCFDMRRECSQGTTLDAARETAAGANVAIALWFLFCSAAKYRAHLTATVSGFRQHY